MSQNRRFIWTWETREYLEDSYDITLPADAKPNDAFEVRDGRVVKHDRFIGDEWQTMSGTAAFTGATEDCL